MGEVIPSRNGDGVCNNVMIMGFWYGIEHHRDRPRYVKVKEDYFVYCCQSAAVLRRIKSSGCSVDEAYAQFHEWINETKGEEDIWEFQ